MGTLYWVSKKKIYQMESFVNLIFLVSFSSIVLASSPKLNWTVDDVSATETTNSLAPAYCNLIAPCPSTFSSLCLCCIFQLFLSKCKSQCQQPNICDCKLTGQYQCFR